MTGTHHENLLGIPATLLADEPELTAAREIDAGRDPAELAAGHPASSLPWAVLAEHALERDATIEGYAYARTGYHRGLDALRRSGWRGQGPVPWSHEPNRGFLRALHALGRAAAAIGEDAEHERCAALLADCDPRAAEALA
jgi:Protein of unknown function (DUF3151)